METIAWPEIGARVSFLTEGTDTPLPPPGRTQTAHRFPTGTRIVQVGAHGFLVVHDDHPAVVVGLDGIASEAPLDKAGHLIESRANSMDGSDVLRFGVLNSQE